MKLLIFWISQTSCASSRHQGLTLVAAAGSEGAGLVDGRDVDGDDASKFLDPDILCFQMPRRAHKISNPKP